MPVTFAELREATLSRTKRWEPGYPESGKWDADYWLLALLGEIGEAANVVKKLDRLAKEVPGAKDPKKSKLLHLLSEELADVICYVDCLRGYLGFGPINDGVREGLSTASAVDYLGPKSRTDLLANTTPVHLGISMGSHWNYCVQRKSVSAHLNLIVYLCELLAGYYEIDIAQALVDKFNKVSERQGFPERLSNE